MRRRDLLSAFAAAAFPFGLQAQRSAGRLRITGIRNLNLRVIREAGSMEAAWNPGTSTKYVVGGGSVVEVQPDQGLTGIGPGVDETVLPSLRGQLIGKDPFDTEQHSARLRYYAAGSSYRGAANVDVALWDLLGKPGGQPSYRNKGGRPSNFDCTTRRCVKTCVRWSVCERPPAGAW
ncbi:MAG: hypothetical protein JNK87_40485 [Bryobacterales bacterium]|nr:hypothetical protein [Bryobacterales bacterium]